ncbi:MAG TPA: DUF2164 domain-containing protein [Opitutaceae bacterium]|nr:DUF2164 domain-containing protein [Opitutaceae bacterium]
MGVELNKQDRESAIASLRRFFSKELESEITELHARLLLDYFLKEIGPFSYNQGVKDAEAFFRARIEDLPGICYEDPLGYWLKKR